MVPEPLMITVTTINSPAMTGMLSIDLSLPLHPHTHTMFLHNMQHAGTMLGPNEKNNCSTHMNYYLTLVHQHKHN